MVLINTDYLLLLQKICKKEILSLKDADKEQSKSINTLSGLNRGKIPAGERSLLNNQAISKYKRNDP